MVERGEEKSPWWPELSQSWAWEAMEEKYNGKRGRGERQEKEADGQPKVAAQHRQQTTSLENAKYERIV